MSRNDYTGGAKTAAVFIGGVVLVGMLLGYLNVPGEWYERLAKPSFNPPNYVFAPVWIALYCLVGAAGARTWSRAPHSAAMRVWFAQMVLNFLWSPVFFSLHLIGWGLVIIVSLLISIIMFIALQLKKDRIAALMFFPYCLWVAFATALNWSIYRLN